MDKSLQQYCKYYKTSIAFYDGETVSRSTKRTKILSEDESEYGRRMDLIVKSKEAEEQYDLCSNEFKKTHVSIDVLTHQQSKSLCINACISNGIHLFFDTNACINYFDFSGRQAYVSLPFIFDDCCSIAYKAGSFTIPQRSYWIRPVPFFLDHFIQLEEVYHRPNY